MTKQKLNIGEAFNAGLSNFKDNIGLWLALEIFVGAAYYALCYIEMNGAEYIHANLGFDPNMEILGLVSFIGTFAGAKFVAGVIFVVGFVKIMLNQARGEKAEFSDLFTECHKIFIFFVAALFVHIIVSAGFFMLVIPGFYLMLALSMAGILVLDKDMGPIESLKESIRITKGHEWHLLGLFILVAVLNAIGAALFVVGLIITLPISYGAVIHAYRHLQGEKK